MSTLIQNLSFISKLMLLVFFIWLSTIAWQRFQEKKTGIASSMSKALIFFTISIIFQITRQLFEINVISRNLFQFAEYFMIFSVFFIYRFSNQLNESDHQFQIKEKFAVIFAIGIIVFGIIKSNVPFQPITEIGTFFYMLEIYVMTYSVIGITPLIRTAVQDQYKIKYENSIIYKRIQDMKWVGMLWILQNMFLCIENILIAYSIPDQGVWILSACYGLSLSALVNSAFYKRIKEKPNAKPVILVGYSSYLKNIK